MKRLFFILIFLSFASNLLAQKEIAVIGGANHIPKTALKVTITVKKEIIEIGPYARYAQQFLGINAPLNDFIHYSIENSVIESVENSVTQHSEISKCGGDIEFLDMGINPIYSTKSSTSAGALNADRTTTTQKSLEAMAEDAARTIFTIRKSKLDIITGETQDAFGAGIKAAIDEMNRIEHEYIALFVGKKSVSYSTYAFGLIPSSNKKNYVLGRFSNQEGMLDILSADGGQIALILAPEQTVQFVVTKDKKGKKEIPNISYIVPEWINATLMLGTTAISTSMINMYQFGKLVLPVIE